MGTTTIRTGPWDETPQSAPEPHDHARVTVDARVECWYGDDVAMAVLHMPDHAVKVSTYAKRHPDDEPIPGVGQDLAVGRALCAAGAQFLGRAQALMAARAEERAEQQRVQQEMRDAAKPKQSSKDKLFQRIISLENQIDNVITEDERMRLGNELNSKLRVLKAELDRLDKGPYKLAVAKRLEALVNRVLVEVFEFTPTEAQKYAAATNDQETNPLPDPSVNYSLVDGPRTPQP